MDKWIKELSKGLPFGNLNSDEVDYDTNIEHEIELNGVFNIAELEALVKHMKRYNK